MCVYVSKPIDCIGVYFQKLFQDGRQGVAGADKNQTLFVRDGK